MSDTTASDYDIPHDPVTGEIVEEGASLSNSLVPLGGGNSVELARAEIDAQVATAHHYPRSIAKTARNLMSLVTMSKEGAAECMYALPRGGKPIVGPSIRFAELLASQWGNCRPSARITEVNRDAKYVEAVGLFLDLETNVGTSKAVRRPISDKAGRIYKDDMINVTGNAACSIAIRNAILAGIPKPVWIAAYQAAEQTVKGDIKTLSERRAAMMTAFAAFGVKPEQIFAVLDIKGIEDVTLDHIPTLTGMYQALKGGEISVEDMFNPRKIGSTHEPVKNALVDEGPGPQKGKAATKPAAPAEEGKEPEGKPTEAPKEEKGPEAPAERDPAPQRRRKPEDQPGIQNPDPIPARQEPDVQHGDPAPAQQSAGPDPMAAAYQAGRKARLGGMAAKIVPGEYRDESKAELLAEYRRGWADEDRGA